MRLFSILAGLTMVAGVAGAAVPNCWGVPGTNEGQFQITVNGSRLDKQELVEAITVFGILSEVTPVGYPVQTDREQVLVTVQGREFKSPERPAVVWHRDVLKKLNELANRYGMKVECSPTIGTAHL